MVKYKVYGKDYYGCEYEEFETESYSKAYHFCKRENEKTSEYVQSCYDNYEPLGNYVYYRFEKVEVKK